MSDGHEHDAHEGAADAHDDHGFDGEPAKELGPDEPMTPGWLPAVGGVLFVGLAFFGLIESRDGLAGPKPAATAAATATQIAAQPVQPPARPTQIPSRPQPLAPGLQPAQNNPGTPEIKKLPPAEIKQILDRLKKGAPPGGPPGAQPPPAAPGGH